MTHTRFEFEPTGLPDAVIVDRMLSLGIDADDVLAMSYEQRVATIRDALADGRISPDWRGILRELGVLA